MSTIGLRKPCNRVARPHHFTTSLYQITFLVSLLYGIVIAYHNQNTALSINYQARILSYSLFLISANVTRFKHPEQIVVVHPLRIQIRGGSRVSVLSQPTHLASQPSIADTRCKRL